MTNYNKVLKDTIINRMMPPSNESVKSISSETGIAETTLYRWKKQARSAGMQYRMEPQNQSLYY